MTAELEDQTWWKDVVEKFENKKCEVSGKHTFVSQQALFDLDGTRSQNHA
jgi:hypothetical protein